MTLNPNYRLITLSDWRLALYCLDAGIITVDKFDDFRPAGVDWNRVIQLCVSFEYWNSISLLIGYYSLAPFDLSLKQQLSLILLEGRNVN